MKNCQFSFGLLIATILNFSTVSSGINSMATVSIVDIVQPVWRKFRPKSPPSLSLIGWMSKILGLVFGAATIGTSFSFIPR